MDRRFDVKEGHDYPTERLERCPGVDLGMLVDRFAELCEGGDVEDLGSEEVLQVMLATLLEFRVANLL